MCGPHVRPKKMKFLVTVYLLFLLGPSFSFSAEPKYDLKKICKGRSCEGVDPVAMKNIVEAFFKSIEDKKPDPMQALVPDELTAISVAEAVGGAIFGKKKMRSQRPFIAFEVGGYWLVSGTLPKGWLGGSVFVKLRRSDGAIVQVGHSQ